ncbi:hypothetical protein BJV74DRAFT_367126 [Russula compacta]|nr:hypothetical protein BJV74DRAFT_367126 [Russula compacta]
MDASRTSARHVVGSCASLTQSGCAGRRESASTFSLAGFALLHSPTTMFSSNSRPLPPRTHSINAVKHANYFASVDEELRDCKRVQRQGQEEDLREALSRMMVRVEEMYETLQSSHQTTTDLETQLTLSESNLKLALANNEMLEDALKSGSLSKDVGWRRSVPSPVVVAPLPASHSQQMSTAIDENENDAQGGDGGGILPDSSDSPSSDHDSRAASPAPAIASQTPNNDSRFFRFRFTGSGRSTPTLPPNSPPLTRASRPGRTSSHPAVGHLTSASLPSLVGSPPLPTAPAPPVVNNELEELREQLLVEKRKSEKITREKSQLEAELENLSQALFEEVRDFPFPPFFVLPGFRSG